LALTPPRKHLNIQILDLKISAKEREREREKEEELVWRDNGEVKRIKI
jgi:hypothetical protein